MTALTPRSFAKGHSLFILVYCISVSKSGIFCNLYSDFLWNQSYNFGFVINNFIIYYINFFRSETQNAV